MLGTLVNTAAVLVGSCIGLLFRKGLPERFGQVIMKGLGLCVMYIGIKGALKGENEIIAILSVAVGAVIGELLRLDERLEKLGGWIERKCKKREDDKTSVTEGFVSASLLFCVGAMTILGSLESGISGDHSTLFLKSILDFTCSIIYASTLGYGVLFSAATVLVIQGSITLLAGWIAPVLTETVILEMSCVGSILIIGLVLNMLGITKLKMMNYIPAIFLPLLFCLFLSQAEIRINNI